MSSAVLEERRNGTGAPPMPIKTVEIDCTEFGYPGWAVTMRLNPRSSVYDQFTAFDAEGKWWQAFGQIVQHWNFTDEEGVPLPQPRDVASERELDLPYGLVAFVFRAYLDAFNAAVLLSPKAGGSSETTSRISGESPPSEQV